ncbi:MAG: DNA-packaging protein [Maricaulaceae bacterium]
MSAASINGLGAAKRKGFLASLSRAESERLLFGWDIWARPDQFPPPGDWRTWVFLGGRGAGKTGAGAEWLRARMETDGAARAALIGPSLGDAREVMVEGVSGLRAIAPARLRPVYETTRRRLVWPNGAQAFVFSAEDADSLRGHAFSAAWADEFAAWRYAEATWSNLQLALRLGDQPQAAVTTTPRPIPALKTLLGEPDVIVTRAPTRANAAFLSPGFVAAMQAAYGGTRLGRQELDGVLIEDPDDALWKRAVLEAAVRPSPPDLARIVVGVDPPAGAGPQADACGIVVAGAVGEGRARLGTVLADATVQGLSPEGWADAVARAMGRFGAGLVVAEANQGGDMVRAVLHAARPDLRVKLVRASRGKRARAEPVAALYEQGRISHAGRFAALEDQMCAFGGDNAGARSPDRVDALVWALTELMLDQTPPPRVRGL